MPKTTFHNLSPEEEALLLEPSLWSSTPEREPASESESKADAGPDMLPEDQAAYSQRHQAHRARLVATPEGRRLAELSPMQQKSASAFASFASILVDALEARFRDTQRRVRIAWFDPDPDYLLDGGAWVHPRLLGWTAPVEITIWRSPLDPAAEIRSKGPTQLQAWAASWPRPTIRKLTDPEFLWLMAEKADLVVLPVGFVLSLPDSSPIDALHKAGKSVVIACDRITNYMLAQGACARAQLEHVPFFPPEQFNPTASSILLAQHATWRQPLCATKALHHLLECMRERHFFGLVYQLADGRMAIGLDHDRAWCMDSGDVVACDHPSQVLDHHAIPEAARHGTPLERALCMLESLDQGAATAKHAVVPWWGPPLPPTELLPGERIHAIVRADDHAQFHAYRRAGYALDVVDADGRTAVHHAVIGCKPQVAAALMIFGASGSTQDRFGWSPAAYAVALGIDPLLDTLREMLFNPADPGIGTASMARVLRWAQPAKPGETYDPRDIEPSITHAQEPVTEHAFETPGSSASPDDTVAPASPAPPAAPAPDDANSMAPRAKAPALRPPPDPAHLPPETASREPRTAPATRARPTALTEAVFSYVTELTSENAAALAKERYAQWLKRSGVPIDDDALLHAESPEHSLVTDEDAATGLFASRWDNRRTAGMIFRIEFVVATVQEKVYASLRLTTIINAAEPRTITATIPGLVRSLADLQPRDAGLAVGQRVHALTAADGHHLVRAILDPHRRMPLIVTSQRDETSNAIGLPAAVQATCSVVHLGPDARSVLTDQLGRQRSVWGDALRIYRPGAKPEDSIYDHPLLLDPAAMSEENLRGRLVTVVAGMTRQTLLTDDDVPSYLTVRGLIARARRHDPARAPQDGSNSELEERLQHTEQERDLYADLASETESRAQERMAELAARHEEELAGMREELAAALTAQSHLQQALARLRTEREAPLEYPTSFAGLEAWAAQALGSHLVLTKRAIRDAAKAPSEPAIIRQAFESLELLAGEYWTMRIQGTPQARQAFEQRCAELRVDVAPTGLAAITHSTEAEYRVRALGRTWTLDMHLRGPSSGKPNKQLRIYFHYCQETGRIVVGSLPLHLTSSLTT